MGPATGAPAPSSFLDACRCLPTERTPVWFMRQAGRALPEYRSARGSSSILDSIRDPRLAAELTLQPVRRYGVDAAIIFSDIMVPLAAVGAGVDVEPGRGPVVKSPITSGSDLERLRPLDAEADVPYVLEAIDIARRELASRGVPLVGFAGAPFTVASYLVEGGPSRDHARTKTMMRAQPELWSDLLDALAVMAVTYLRAQVGAGAQAVQLFDSWAGALSPSDYATYALPSTTKVLAGVADLDVPRIHFGVGTGELLPLMASAGAEVIGVDWRVSIADARARVGGGHAIQGNLDPTVCLAPWETVEAEVRRILEDAGDEPGFIFNLGHGVLPDTDPEVLAQIVELVHARPA